MAVGAVASVTVFEVYDGCRGEVGAAGFAGRVSEVDDDICRDCRIGRGSGCNGIAETEVDVDYGGDAR